MSLFPARWPVQHPDRIQLYSLATPNGQKAGIMLEEAGLPYEAHLVNIMENHQFDADYAAINPNSKIPTLIDPDGPGGQPIALMESGAILLHLARKAGRLLPTDPRKELQTLQWMLFQVGHVGPMFGQFGHFYKFAKGKTDTYGEERYGKEVTRLLGVLDGHLASREWLVDEFTIADIMTVPWINALDFYDGKDAVGYGDFPHVHAWVARFMERPGVQRGVQVCRPG
ncbi:MAG: glutathione S-transferase N-terminal domain-containing protein [Myxococcales bacterium]|nr:glutathione S-transferase N-terminal domain-containing protein [Myxococcales bacterium]